MTNDPYTPPGSPSPSSSSPLGLSIVMVRALVPPLMLGSALAASIFIRGGDASNMAGVLLIASIVLMLANIVHLSYQIVTKPAEPPLGMPRIASGILLFFGLSLLQVVVTATAAFAGCACAAQLGHKPNLF